MVIQQHLDQFFQIEGIAFCPFDQFIAQVFRHIRHFLQDVQQQITAVAFVQRFQIEPRMKALSAAPCRAAFIEQSAGGCQHQQMSGIIGDKEIVQQVK